MIKYADRVFETSTTQGTGTLNLSGAVAGYRSFVAGVTTGSKVPYCIKDNTNWEVGIGTITDATPDTLSRDYIIASSNGGSAVNWGAGTRDVFLAASNVLQFLRDENLNDVNQIAVSSSGTGNAHVATPLITPRAVSDGMIVRWRAPATNTGAITLNWGSLGAISYVNNDGTDFASGNIVSGRVQEAIYRSSTGKFERTSPFYPPTPAASAVTYSNGTSGLVATNVQSAIDELAAVPPVIHRNYFDGFQMSTAGSSATMNIGAGQCANSTNTNLISLLTALAKTTSSWALGTAAGGLDAGTIANGTWYHFFAIKRTDTGVVDALCSLSHGNNSVVTMTIATPGVVTWAEHGLQAGSPVKFSTTGALPTGVTAGTQYYVIATGLTASSFRFSTSIGGSAVNTTGSQSGVHTCTAAPVLPTNYTLYRRIGSGRTNGSAQWIEFQQRGNRFIWKVSDMQSSFAVGTSRTLCTALAPINTTALLSIALGAGSAASTIIQPTYETDVAPSSGGKGQLISYPSLFNGADYEVGLDSSSQFAMRGSIAVSGQVVTRGWVDMRGQE